MWVSDLLQSVAGCVVFFVLRWYESGSHRNGFMEVSMCEILAYLNEAIKGNSCGLNIFDILLVSKMVIVWQIVFHLYFFFNVHLTPSRPPRTSIMPILHAKHLFRASEPKTVKHTSLGVVLAKWNGISVKRGYAPRVQCNWSAKQRIAVQDLKTWRRHAVKGLYTNVEELAHWRAKSS